MRSARTMAAMTIGVAVSAAAASDTAAQTHPDTFRLRQLVVTATRSPLPLAAVPAAVTVLHAAELEARGIRFVADALRDVPGISVAQSGSYGGLTAAFVRGGEGDYVQVLVDGVQINEPGGVISFGHLTTADVDRIEIVRGPVSVLYGSDAVTGVIQIFTRAGSARPRVTAQLSGARGSKVGAHAAGSFHVVDWNAGVTGTAAKLRYGVTASGMQTDGIYAFNNDYGNRTASAKLEFAGDRTDASVSARFVDRKFHYPTTGSGAIVDRNKFSAGELRTVGIELGHRLHERLELRGSAGSHRSADGEDDPRDQPDDDLSVSRSFVERITADVRLNATLATRALLTIGAEREWQDGRSSFHGEGSFGPFDAASDDDRQSTGWYAQLLTTPLAHTTLTLGARIDDNDRFGTFDTYRAGIARELGAWRVHATFGTGFKEPTFYENFATGFVRGDPALQPEESRSVELGAEARFPGGHIGITLFDQLFRNLIQYTATPPAQSAPNYHNVGRAVARGAELSGLAALTPGVAARLAYTYLHTRVTDEGFGEDRLFQAGAQLIRRPAHQASIGMDATLTRRTRATATARYVGARDDLDFTDPAEWQGRRVTQPAYGTLDVGIQHELRSGTHSATAFADVENVTDGHYEPVFNFPARGRLLRLGVRASY